MNRWQMRLTKGKNLSWRAGIAVAAFVAASTLVSADLTSYQLMLPLQNPHITFDGSSASRIAYDGTGGLTVDAGAQFITLPSTTMPPQEQFLIVTTTAGPVPLAGGVCPVGYFRAVDANGLNLACWADQGPAPPGAYGAFRIRARVDGFGNITGGVLPGVPDACGLLNGDDFCVSGTVLRCLEAPGNPQACFTLPAPTWQMVYAPGILVTGELKTTLGTQIFASQDHTLNPYNLDFFEFLLQVTGGQLANVFPPAAAGDPRKFLDVQSAAFVDGTTGFKLTSTDVPWSHGFSESVEGSVDSVKAFPFMLPPDDRCNGRISGTVLDAVSLNGIADTTMSVHGGDLVTAEQQTTGLTGVYSFTSTAVHSTGLCAGTYTVYAAPPLGWAPMDNYPSSVSVTLTKDTAGNDTSSIVPFQFYQTGAISSVFQTWGQGQWGAKPKAMNAGALLQAYYFIVYGSGPVVIGGTNTVTMTGPVAIQNFLPQGGRPMPLDGSYIDPLVMLGQRKPHRWLGSLAGETLALRLNVDFSDNLLTRPGLGALHVAVGPFMGKTVNEVLALGNSVLGGAALPAGMKYDTVEDTIEMINKNFEGGKDRKYLKP